MESTVQSRFLCDFLSHFLAMFLYLLLGIELFVNAPMNGWYRLPGRWDKDSTLVWGLGATFFLAVVMPWVWSPPWYASLLLLLAYFYGMTCRTRRSTYKS